MTTIVITGHGNFATGIQSMLQLVLGQSEQVYFVDFTENMTSTQLKVKFQEIYQKYNGKLIFLADIAGGTPFNEASMLMHKHGNCVLGGINIPGILAAIDIREQESDPQIILETTHSAGIQNMKIVDLLTNTDTEENPIEGI